MLKRCRCFFIQCLLCCFLFDFTAHAKLSSVILGVGEWKPYVDRDDIDGGTITKIVREAFQSQNILVGFQYQPWKRVYVLAKAGHIDGTFPWVKTEQREKLFYFSHPLGKEKTVIFFNTSKPVHGHGYSELAGLIVGGTAGYNYGQEISLMIKNGLIKYVEAYSDYVNLKLLIHRKIEAFPCDIKVCQQILKDKFSLTDAAKISYNKDFSQEDALFFMVSKSHPKALEIIDAVNQGLSAIQ